MIDAILALDIIGAYMQDTIMQFRQASVKMCEIYQYNISALRNYFINH